ncbi:hypothetical protein ETU08_05115 [Apibacter muscae]|uniref:Peptidyl-prolyl cis-trans isomerase n=1 Tax=Apibacter muscae TaxID=2509004 RepID=A0A563DFF7_9FLAO|nr:FKBP-type peptidyl-prolyl cis-trans isomerase [Apibacter muscae]TWP28807.1 hypothetical protein ETU09_05690 [Apibacter muscae]TWP29942.1 hypothetical protein ETU08_05115 [Apibacter muscae]
MLLVNYIHKTIDRYVVENSKNIYGQPVDIPLNQVVSGWQEGVKIMDKGSKNTLYVHAKLAYGENSFVGHNQTLIFEVELVDFISMTKPEEQIVPTKNAELIQQYEEQIELYRK